MGKERNTSMLRHGQLSATRLSIAEHATTYENADISSSERSLQMLAQDQTGDNQFICQSLDVVDACRGTSNSYRFRGNFAPYEGSCSKFAKILDGYPIYKTTATNEIPRYMYAIDVYSDTWSVKELRGLVRWRIVDFEDFKDQTSCRTESANVNQIDFAADGQPFNYWPTIFCFDEDGGELDGYKSSTINIRCNDRSPAYGYNGDGSSGGTVNSIDETATGNVSLEMEESKTALVLGILLIVTAVAFGIFIAYNRICSRRKQYPGYPKAKTPTKVSRDSTSSDRQKTDLEGMTLTIGTDEPSKAKLAKTPSAPDMSVKEQLYPEQIRPDSSNSIMADSMHSDPGGLPMPSMHTVSKPYDLVKRRMPRKAPEPPKSPVSSQNEDIALKKFTASNVDTNEKGNESPEEEIQKSLRKLPDERREEASIKKAGKSLNNDDKEDASFLSESLSNLFKDIDKSLDQALADDKLEGDKKNGLTTFQYQHLDPPRPKESTNPNGPSSTPSGKNDEMDLSLRSKFAEERRKWSLRGKLFGKEMNDEIRRSGRPQNQNIPSRGADTTVQRALNDEIRQPIAKGGANIYPQSNRRSRSREHSGASNYQSQRQPISRNGRSRSRERSGADAFAKNNAKRSGSKERSASNAFVNQKNGKRGRSHERSGANNYATGKGRSKSREQSGASEYAQHQERRRDHSLEKAPRGVHPGGKTSKTRSRSFDGSDANKYAAKGNKSEKAKTRSRSFDPSGASNYVDRNNANLVDQKGTTSRPSDSGKKNRTAVPSTTITKHPDGTVVVAGRRKREDGATVVTKTKYANVKLARKHGVAV
mmetsp:Transcript_16546/g.38224  ORF Transcript_16546/g.38224 Transcript_16546/m.38224 type:complete len:818 (+) Transcript_16546:296-2749(+)